MRYSTIAILALSTAAQAGAHPANAPAQVPLIPASGAFDNHTVSPELFTELEELARIVDISYCVGYGGRGIQKPFKCASRCSEFPSFELVRGWNTGPLLSDSSGYIALSHAPAAKRIILAFRGTYSLANTIADLSTVPQSYVPYPGDDGDQATVKYVNEFLRRKTDNETPPPPSPPKCENCTVHMGFYRSWLNTRSEILSDLSVAIKSYPDYQITLVGHSLGGAIATLAALDLKARGWDPITTTFGEPRIGNAAFMSYIDETFGISSENTSDFHEQSPLRRVTHASDPIPLLPLDEWGYKMHAGEIYIAAPNLPPSNSDIRHCAGDEDHHCIAGSDDIAAKDMPKSRGEANRVIDDIIPYLEKDWETVARRELWNVPTRYKLWQLFFAHRDYFWRLGLCVAGSDPKDWWRGKYEQPQVIDETEIVDY